MKMAGLHLEAYNGWEYIVMFGDDRGSVKLTSEGKREVDKHDLELICHRSASNKCS